jgi:hypothetical protein
MKYLIKNMKLFSPFIWSYFYLNENNQVSTESEFMINIKIDKIINTILLVPGILLKKSYTILSIFLLY